jgi:hypothetical protein
MLKERSRIVLIRLQCECLTFKLCSGSSVKCGTASHMRILCKRAQNYSYIAAPVLRVRIRIIVMLIQ